MLFRSMLLEYFGEKNTTPCGQCDYCIRNKEQEISKTDWERITAEIQEMKHADVAVISKKTGISERKVIEVLRQMRDE